MKILAVLLIISSLTKLTLSAIGNNIKITEANDMIDPDWLHSIICAIITADGLIGLFCGLFILFMT